jgi:hypothetical protein
MLPDKMRIPWQRALLTCRLKKNDAEGGTAEGGAAEGGEEHAGENTEAPTNVPGQVIPLTEHTNDTQTAKSETADENTGKGNRPRQYRERRNRGPPEDGIVSKTKVMVANLPYDYTEDKVCVASLYPSFRIYPSY